MPGVYAANPGKPRAREVRPDCPACLTTHARCEAGFWLRSGYCCPDCHHEEAVSNDERSA